MRASKAIVLYAVAVIALGALLAPSVFWAAQGAGHLLQSEWLSRQPFRRVFDRTLLLVALAGLWPLLRAVGIRLWNTLGFAHTADWWRPALLGAALGVGSFLIAGTISLVVGARVLDFDKPAAEVASRLLKYLATGIVVALIEETFFRGGIQGALQRGMPFVPALVVASAVYSALHFLKPAGVVIAPEQVQWYSGFDCLSQVVSRSLFAPGVAVGFVTLFLAGWILGWAFAKTRSLYLSMGLHAGWVFTLKSYGFFTNADVSGTGRWLGAGALTENIATWPVLVGTFFLVAWLCRGKLKPSQE